MPDRLSFVKSRLLKIMLRFRLSAAQTLQQKVQPPYQHFFLIVLNSGKIVFLLIGNGFDCHQGYIPWNLQVHLLENVT